MSDKTFSREKFLVTVRASPSYPKTAYPSPEIFKEACEYDAEDIFMVTLSNNSSGAYDGVALARELYGEEHRKKNIAVIDSWSASSGELNIGLMIRDLCEQGIPFEEVVEKAMQYTQREMKTYFVLGSLDTLRKNRRLFGLQVFLATTLNIKPVVGADKGNIVKLDQVRGINKAFVRMRELVVKEVRNPKTLRVVVAHRNNGARAQLVKEELSKRAPSKEIIVTGTTGAAVMYANDGGIILALQGFDRIRRCLE